MGVRGGHSNILRGLQPARLPHLHLLPDTWSRPVSEGLGTWAGGRKEGQEEVRPADALVLLLTAPGNGLPRHWPREQPGSGRDTHWRLVQGPALASKAQELPEHSYESHCPPPPAINWAGSGELGQEQIPPHHSARQTVPKGLWQPNRASATLSGKPQLSPRPPKVL